MIANVWNRVALPTVLSLGALLMIAALCTMGADTNAAKNSRGETLSTNGAISPKDEADALHFVIAADRDLYCRVFIALQAGDTPPPEVSDGGKPKERWPLPSEMFRRAAESIQSKGAEFSYALRSLSPVDPRNEPQTELERTGLAFIASHPEQNYYGQEMLGGRRYFTAVYPDIPAAAACVDCHNQRPASIGRRHAAGEVMGGIVVRVPLEF